MKKLLFPILLILSFNLIAQEEKTVTLTVSGQGQTQDEAKQNALRNAIEQAFGAFISSKTEILNDELVKDEIVSVSNGNIQKFEVVSEVKIPDGGYATTLKATVSVTKLTSFVEGKGGVVEFKGSLFAFNLNQQKTNERNEVKAIQQIITVTSEILKKSFSAEITLKEPTLSKEDNYRLPLDIIISPNENINIATDYFYKGIESLAMSREEIENYSQLKKEVYYLDFLTCKKPINGILEFYYPHARTRPEKMSLYELIHTPQYRMDLPKMIVKPDFSFRNYSFNTFVLRSEVSLDLIQKFINNIYSFATDFTIYNQNQESIDFDNFFTIGVMPISSIENQFNFFCKNFPFNYKNRRITIIDDPTIKTKDVYWQSDFQKLTLRRSIGSERFYAGYFIQYYSNDSHLLRIVGNCVFSSKELKSISSISLKYK